MPSVGAFEAKAKLLELLDPVERAEEIIITRHGKAAARLVPPDYIRTAPAAKATKAEIMALASHFQSLIKGKFSSTDVDSILYDENR